jgi:tetratricopeptide (TPR) repeat protein
MLVSSLLGSRLGALALIVFFLWGADRFTWQLFPKPLRAFNRWRRTMELRRLIAINPNDRRSRLELADILVGQGGYSAAVEILKPNLAAGDDDATTLYVMGVACLGSNHPDQGEVFLNAARERDANYRMGAIDLELGRWRIARGNLVGAREALERFCELRRGTVEGKVLLARALTESGDAAGAEKLRQLAWDDYASEPGFQRRQDRRWAWRARPSRPITYALITVACVFFFTQWVLPRIPTQPPRRSPMRMRVQRDE